MLQVSGNGLICNENRKREARIYPSFVGASRTELRLARKRMRLDDNTTILLHYQLVFI